MTRQIQSICFSKNRFKRDQIDDYLRQYTLTSLGKRYEGSKFWRIWLRERDWKKRLKLLLIERGVLLLMQ